MVKIIDATGLVMGRLSSSVAKSLLQDQKLEIAIVNAEKCLISGSRKRVSEQYLGKRAMNHPRKGPYFPRMPDMILKRTIRGMLPYQQPRGREALKRVKVYIGTPAEFKGAKAETVDQARNVDLEFYVELGEVSRILGVKLKGVE